MISLLLALALSNMPPPLRTECKTVGATCMAVGHQPGSCVKSQCPRTEFNKQGSKTVLVECLVCQAPSTDGGTR